MKKVLAFAAALALLAAPVNALAAPEPAQAAAVADNSVTYPGADSSAGANSAELAGVIAYAKDLFAISDSYADFTYSLSAASGVTLYYLNWTDDSGSTVNVGVTADKHVTSYSKYLNKVYYQNEIKSLRHISKDSALDAAQGFLKAVDADNYGAFKPGDTTFYTNQYAVNFNYYVNGIRVTDKGANVTLDAATGEIQSYYSTLYNYADNVYPKQKGVMSRDQAVIAFSENADIQLNYVSSYDGAARENTVRLEYVCGPNTVVDALTGKMTSPYSGAPGLTGGRWNMASTADAAGALSPAEQKAVDKTADMISAEAAAKAVTDALPDYAAGMTVSDSNLSTSYNGTASYYISFVGADSQKSLGATVDAYTKDITSFSYYDQNLYDSSAGKTADNTAAANALVKKLAPKYFDQMRLDKDSLSAQLGVDNGGRGYYSYFRLVNGIPYKTNGANVMFAGDLPTSYNLTWEDTTFPSADNVMSRDKAVSGLFEKLDFGLRYVPVNNDSQSAAPRTVKIARAQTTGQYALGYMFDSDITLDALTGELINPPGQQNAVSYDDIKGSPIEDEINQLADIGVSFPGKSFNADNPVGKDEFAALIAQCHYYPARPMPVSSDTGGAGGAPKAVQPLGSAEAVSMIIKDLGFDKITAKNFELVNTYGNIGDVPKQYKNDIQLGKLFGLNIGGGSDFVLKDSITRRDAINLVYNFIKNYN